MIYFIYFDVQVSFASKVNIFSEMQKFYLRNIPQ